MDEQQRIGLDGDPRVAHLGLGHGLPAGAAEEGGELRLGMDADRLTSCGETAPTDFGQLQLARFVNKTGLEAIGDNLFLETAASGTPQDGPAASEGFGDLLQGYLEQANVNAVSEISDLIAAQRAYEMNSKVIQAADQMGQTLSTGIRS